MVYAPLAFTSAQAVSSIALDDWKHTTLDFDSLTASHSTKKGPNRNDAAHAKENAWIKFVRD